MALQSQGYRLGLVGCYATALGVLAVVLALNLPLAALFHLGGSSAALGGQPSTGSEADDASHGLAPAEAAELATETPTATPTVLSLAAEETAIPTEVAGLIVEAPSPEPTATPTSTPTPSPEPTVTPTATPSETPPGLQSPGFRAVLEYTVVEGDTVASLAQRYAISAETITRANNLGASDALKPGQELLILPVSGSLYTVADGDTILSLAERFGVIPEEIVAVNDLADPDVIKPGQLLVVPKIIQPDLLSPTPPPTATAQPTTAPTATPQPTATSQPSGGQTYEVVAGDTLNLIASRLGVSRDALVAANHLDIAQPLQIGQRLVVPTSGGASASPSSSPIASPTPSPTLSPTPSPVASASPSAGGVSAASGGGKHVVKAGETLTRISIQYGVSVASIVQANGLSEPYLLKVGQQLNIPSGQVSAGSQPPAPTATATPPPAPTSAPTATPAPPTATAMPKPAPPTATPTPQPQPPTGPSASGTGAAVVSAALKFQGTRYVWGGTSPQTGFDCSGFVWYVLRQSGVAMPRDLGSQLNTGRRIDRYALQPGDIIFFQNTYKAGLSHDGIYIGGGQFVHAASENVGVIVSKLDHPYWSPRFVGATRPY